MLDRTTTAAASVEISLRAGDLYDAFARTRHAICKEQTRYYLAGVYIHPSSDGKVLNFVATDGHRLAQVRVPITQAATFEPVLVGPAFVNEALRFFGRKSQHVLSATLTLSRRSVCLVDWQGERIETEPVDCSYPDYARTVPHEAPRRVMVGKGELLAALEPVVGFLKPTQQRAVKLSVTGDTLTLAVNVTATYPYDLAATMGATVKLSDRVPQPYETGFNAEYLLEALKTFGDRYQRSPAVVSICSHDLGSPHVIACDSHETYVLMPMRV
jgi:DNA polymerase III subunit beta